MIVAEVYAMRPFKFRTGKSYEANETVMRIQVRDEEALRCVRKNLNWSSCGIRLVEEKEKKTRSKKED